MVRNETGYNLYNISKKSEHVGFTLALDLLGSKNEKAVTGSSVDNCIKVWNIGPCDLVSEFTYRNAHCDAVTGISSKPDDGHVFASCSRDRTLSIWDTRNIRPAVDWFDGKYAYTTVRWFMHNGVEHLFAGDETGNLNVHDPRNMSCVADIVTVHSRPILKIKENDDLIAVLSQSNVIHVLDITTQYSETYTNSNADDFVRDALWKGKQEFYSIGWDSKVSKHSF